MVPGFTWVAVATEITRGDSGLAAKLVQNWKISVLLRALALRHLQDDWFPRYMADPQFLYIVYANTGQSAGMLQGGGQLPRPARHVRAARHPVQ